MQYRPFDPECATEDDFRAVYALASEARAVDWPELPQGSYDALVHRLRNAASGPEPETLWLAERDGELAATAYYELGLVENTHLATITISVHPKLRRQGIATDFLRALLAEVRRDGRSRVMGPHVRSGAGAEQWTSRVGFAPAQTYVMQTLEIAQVDRARWDVPVAEGYRLAAWTDAAPEDVVASYARARRAIFDALRGELTWEDPDWTAERVRQEESDHREAGREHHVVVAVDEASGEVVGMTQLMLRLAQPDRASQMDTAVVREHRGHGLGRAMKAAMMRRLLAARPDVATVATQTADVDHMAAINRELGYRTLAEYCYVEADLDELRSALDA